MDGERGRRPSWIVARVAKTAGIYLLKKVLIIQRMAGQMILQRMAGQMIFVQAVHVWPLYLSYIKTHF